jgi:hypothetical protein
MYRQKIIFLDVDGVLNPQVNVNIRRTNGEPTDSYSIKIPGDKIYRLKKIVNATGAILIMSSNWRLGFSYRTMAPSPAFRNLNSQLLPYGIHLSGWTPLQENRNRGLEIEWYLRNFERQHGYRPGYIIIDDDISDLVELHKGHIVNTTQLLGLQDIHVKIAISLLNKQE